MITLSVCMIVKDEKDVLYNSLNSVASFADEIIIVDTGSTDNTKDIARNYTDKIYDFEWCDDFSKARNFSFSKATCDYIMWIDADDIMPIEEQKKMIALKEELDTSIDIVMAKYVTVYSKDMQEQFSFYRERIFKKNKNYTWVDPVHELIIPHGKIYYSNIKIYHNKLKKSPKGRNLKIYRKMVKDKVKFSARQLFYYGNELAFNKYYKSAITIYKKFLSNKEGWVENKIEACKNIALCFKQLKDTNTALQYLYESFIYSLPRAAVCNEIGNIYFENKQYTNAIYWYNLSTIDKPNENSGAFIRHDSYTYIPYTQLMLCYYYIGDIKNAKKYHELCKKLRPTDAMVLHNDKVFEQYINKEKG